MRIYLAIATMIWLSTIFISTSAVCETFVVDDDGGRWANFTTIQGAIDSARGGDTIRVYAGAYLEAIDIDRVLDVIGNGSHETIIDSTNDTAVKITSNNVEFSGFTIYRTLTNADSVYIREQSWVSISNILFMAEEHGNCIEAQDCSDISITNSSFYNSTSFAVYAYGSSNLYIADNEFMNAGSYGAYLRNSNGTIERNNFSDENEGVQITDLAGSILRYNSIYRLDMHDVDNAVVEGNILSHRFSYIKVHENEYAIIQNNTFINNTNSRAIEVYQCDYITIANNTDPSSIYIGYYAYNIRCFNNTAKSSLTVYRTEDSDVFSNIASRMYVDDSEEVYITSNYLSLGIIELTRTDDCVVNQNNLENGNGIRLTDSDANIIQDNSVAGGKIEIYSGYDNIIRYNEVFNCSSHGIIVLANDNEIYYNNFAFNDKGYRQISENSKKDCKWNMSNGGNFWSDLAGEDLDGDGILDCDYVINGEPFDRQPLASPKPNQAPVKMPTALCFQRGNPVYDKYYITNQTGFNASYVGWIDAGANFSSEIRYWEGGSWSNWTPADYFEFTDYGSVSIEYRGSFEGNSTGIMNQSYFLDGRRPVGSWYLENEIIKGNKTWISNDGWLYVNFDDGRGCGIYNIYYRRWDGDWSNWVRYVSKISFSGSGLRHAEFYAKEWMGYDSLIGNVTVYTDWSEPIINYETGAPSFYGDRRYVTNTTEIRVTATDAGVGVNSTYYRKWHDGKFSKYINASENATFDKEGENMLFINSSDFLGNEIMVYDFWYVDLTPPVTNCTITNSLRGTNGSTLTNHTTVSFIANDNDGCGVNSTTYRVWKGSWSDWKVMYGDDHGIVLDQGDGEYIIDHHSTDELGNQEDTNRISFTLDTLAPQTNLSFNTTLVDGYWSALNNSLSIQGSDDTGTGVWKTYLRITHNGSSSGWREYEHPFEFNSSGSYIVDFYSIDHVNNTEASKSINFSVDVRPPKSIATFIGPFREFGNWITNETAVNLSATDKRSGPLPVRYSIWHDGSWSPNAEYESELIFDANGLYRVHYNSVDKVGNVEAINNLTLRVDSSPPIVNHSFDGDVYNGTLPVISVFTKIKLEADDGDGVGLRNISFRVMKDGEWGNWTRYESTISFTNGSNHTIEYVSSDKLQNMLPKSSFEFILDVEPPSTTSSIIGWWQVSDQVLLNATDGDTEVKRIGFKVDESSYVYITGSTCNITGLEDGEHTIRYFAIDIYGNQEDVVMEEFEVDTTPPKVGVRINNTINLSVFNFRANVYFVLNDEGSGPKHIEYRLKGEAFWSIWEFGNSYIPFKDLGNYTIEYRAVDELGNTGETTELRFSVVDPTKDPEPLVIPSDDEKKEGIPELGFILLFAVIGVLTLLIALKVARRGTAAPPGPAGRPRPPSAVRKDVDVKPVKKLKAPPKDGIARKVASHGKEAPAQDKKDEFIEDEDKMPEVDFEDLL